MLRIVALTACLVTGGAFAQSAHDHHGNKSPAPNANMHDQMMQGHTMKHGNSAAVTATQPGQSAFAAIQEIVDILEADPKTDWSKVNIDALREHLVDMSNVTLDDRHATQLRLHRKFQDAASDLGHAATLRLWYRNLQVQ